mgnify:CR=1 FL=1
MIGKILIVDDVSSNRIVFKVKLTAAGYQTTATADGDVALRLAVVERPDVIVLNLGLAALQLQSPLMRAFIPKLAQTDPVTDKALNRKILGAISVFCIAPCFFLGIFAHWFLKNWLNDPLVAAQCTLPMQLILMAVSVNAFYQLIYQRLLLLSLGRVIVLINLISLVVVLAFLLLAAPVYGVAAGGASWLVLTLVQFAAGVCFLQVHQKKHLPI